MKEVQRELALVQSTATAWKLHGGTALQAASRHTFHKGHAVPSHQKQTNTQQRGSTLLCTCLFKEPAEPPLPSRGRTGAVRRGKVGLVLPSGFVPPLSRSCRIPQGGRGPITFSSEVSPSLGWKWLSSDSWAAAYKL